ncbi:hypothetical protein Dda_6889 [Drechslerella dactyloides]|uniref:Uncharacterized protein n=1 Tax=Drechslerella dactyloides TaxID=74499 RepID=A0AAD6NHU3_DREDA|nr:hypothetical protein Dda_6889 [Drechslerella dactyloides]
MNPKKSIHHGIIFLYAAWPILVSSWLMQLATNLPIVPLKIGTSLLPQYHTLYQGTNNDPPLSIYTCVNINYDLVPLGTVLTHFTLARDPPKSDPAQSTDESLRDTVRGVAFYDGIDCETSKIRMIYRLKEKYDPEFPSLLLADGPIIPPWQYGSWRPVFLSGQQVYSNALASINPGEYLRFMRHEVVEQVIESLQERFADEEVPTELIIQQEGEGKILSPNEDEPRMAIESGETNEVNLFSSPNIRSLLGNKTTGGAAAFNFEDTNASSGFELNGMKIEYPDPQQTEFTNPNDFFRIMSPQPQNLANTRIIETGPYIDIIDDDLTPDPSSRIKNVSPENTNGPTFSLNIALDNAANPEAIESVQDGLASGLSGKMAEENTEIDRTDLQTVVEGEEVPPTNIPTGNAGGESLSGEQRGGPNEGKILEMLPPGLFPNRQQGQGRGPPISQWENPAMLNNRLTYLSDVMRLDRPYLTSLDGILKNSNNKLEGTLERFTNDQNSENTDVYLREMERLVRQRTEYILMNEKLYLDRLTDLGKGLKRKDDMILAGTRDPNEQDAIGPVLTSQIEYPEGQSRDRLQESLPSGADDRQVANSVLDQRPASNEERQNDS